MYRNLFVLFALPMLSLAAHASHLVRLDVDRDADTYEIRVEMEVDAPVESVRAVLTDYNNLDRLSASIKTSKVIGTGQNGAIRVRTRMQNCVLFFCMDMHKVEDVTEDAQGRILVAIVPQDSSFRSGYAQWEIHRSGTGTRVIHHARMEPKIAVPPLIGTAVMKKTLRREILESFEKLDCLARTECDGNSVHGETDDWDDSVYGF